MTDTTNEIICKCGHSADKHAPDYGCCVYELDVVCQCAQEPEDLYFENMHTLRSRLSALQTEVEGRGETIREAIRIARHSMLESDLVPQPYVKREVVETYLNMIENALAATAPVEGETPNKEDEK